jgi:TatD DNase family protein
VNYFDTHCHLNHSSFQPDLDEVLQRAFDSGVTNILVPGWDLNSSQAAVDLAEKYPQIVAAVGIHPTEIMFDHALPLHEICELCKHPKVVAIGEIGLDYHHDPDHVQDQQSLLAELLEIATEADKPVILHSRESMDDVKQIILEWVNHLPLTTFKLLKCPGIFHAFEGNLHDAMELIQYGFRFGVGGPLTYKNASLKKEVFSTLPVQNICLETDAPYLSPAKHRGERNEPSFIPIVADTLSRLRDEISDALYNQIFENSYRIFIKEKAS